MNVGNLYAGIKLNTGQFLAGIKELTDAAKSLGASLSRAFGPNLQHSINQTQNSIERLTVSMKDIDRIVSGILISQAFYNAINAIEDGIRTVTWFKNEMIESQIAMKYLLGSAEDAQAFILNMQDFAVETAFNTEQAIALSRRLLGAGFDPRQIRDLMEILNGVNAVTGASAEQMDRIVLAISQIKTNGKLAGQELRQLAEAGIPVYSILQQELGLTGEQLNKIGELAIPANVALQALFNGLRRYENAAKEIANTVPGMWETIKDNILMLSSEIFDAPYRALERFLRRWRDAMEEARKISLEQGLGGVFERFVPEELKTPIRIILGSIKSLAESFRALMQAIKPAADFLMTTVVKALSVILPPLAAIIRVLVGLVAAIMDAAPWVKYLVAAIIGLSVANAAAKALMFLWSVTRIGLIAAAVARAVKMLGQAIMFVTAVMTRNPLTGAIMVLAGALLYLALSSKVASAWLANLGKMLGQLAGIDINKILQPTESKDIDKWLEKFNEQVNLIGEGIDDIGKGTDKTGKKAEKAGKKIKDKFIAAFDEVYQVPENLDKVGDALDDISGIDLGGIGGGIGNIPPLDVTTPPNLDDFADKLKDIFDDVPPLFENTKPWRLPPIEPPTIPPPNFAVVTEALETIESRIASFRAKLQELFSPSLSPIPQWVAGTSSALRNWANDVGNIFRDWVTNTGNAVRDWVNNTGQSIKDLVTDTGNTIRDWVNDTGQSLKDWVTDVGTSLSGWATNTGNTVRDWVNDTRQSLKDWVTDTRGAIRDWVTDVGTSLSGWATNGLGTISTWAVETYSRFKEWRQNVVSEIMGWASQTGSNILSWIQNTTTNISTWAVGNANNIKQWAYNAKTTIRTWAVEAAKNVWQWGTNTGQNIATWANTGVKNIGLWAVNSYKSISTWINNTATGIANWVNNAAKNVGAFATAAFKAIEGWASSSWSAFNRWLSGTASGVSRWAKNTINTIVSWAQSAWQALKNLARSVGETIGAWSGNVASSVQSAVAGIGEWVSQNKNWLIPVTVGAIIVGGALAVAMSSGAAAPALAPLLALKTGGIVDKEQIVRISEGNKREAVIPLENSTYMRPFSAAVANDLVQILGLNTAARQPIQDERPILYVGTLIADQRSLRELERKLHVIRLQEGMRGGLKYDLD